MSSQMSSLEMVSDFVSLSDTERANGTGSSDDERTPHVNNKAHCDEGRPDSGSPRVIVDNPNVVDMGHGDVELRMIQNMRCHDSLSSIPCITIYRDERGVDDINNTFKILYASIIEGPFSFETPVLISALRIATAYGFENLRTFAIKHLENVSLGAIQRIQLAREFGLPSWEDPAYKELSEREKAIAEEEAQILGFAAFARVAQAREDIVLKKGKLLGEQETKDKLEKEKEEKAKKEAEEKNKKDAEEKAKKEAEEKAKKAAEEEAKREVEEKAKKEAEEKAKKEAEEIAKKEAEKKAKEAEDKAKKEAEERAQKEAENAGKEGDIGSNNRSGFGSKETTADEVTKRMILDTPNVIDMGHSDVTLQINNTIFKTHKHVLCKFAHLEIMLQNTGPPEPTGSNPSITLHRDEHGVEDVINTFKILYATVIDGPFHFEPTILVSALRISTAYDFPNLRRYAIGELEKASLGAIQRIQIAQEFGLVSWEAPAYSELSKREDALTSEEAQILGFSAFAAIAQAREEESLKRGKTLGKQELMKEIKLGQERVKKKRGEERVKKLAELRVKLKA